MLEDLAAHGVGLGPRLSAALLARAPALATVELAGAVLEVREALEFWPLVGDVASQEQHTARLVDASTRRLEVRVRVPHRAALADPAGRVGADGWAVPLQECGEGLWVGAVRYRAFAPRPGLHPGLAPHDPLTLTWTRAGCPPVVLSLHGWRPDGGGYPGLPADAAEAHARRAARVVRRTPGPDAGAPPCPAPRGRADSCTLDLRRLPAGPAPRTHTP